MNFFGRENLSRVQPLKFVSGFAGENGLCPEVLFNHILSWERKRTERSHRPFLLMLLDIRELAVNGSGQVLKDKMARALCESTRDIDQRGWYVQDHVMGVIFSELCGQDIIQAQGLVWQRVQTGLCQALSPHELRKIDVSLHVFPEGCDVGDASQQSNRILYPDLHMESHLRRADLTMKRAVDILGSLVALILLSPVFALVAAAIKLTSNGPILFRQDRIGQFGRRFTFLKFRSMKVNNDAAIHKEYVLKLICGDLPQTSENGNPVFKIQNDPRVTAVGRFIRRTSLDEIPQFLNVLAGHMSLVGPRPPIPYELEKYDTWHRQRVLSMKPGITGLWQVNGRSRTTFDEMVRLDIRYIREWSFWMDLRLLVATPWVVFTGKGGF
jgi:lipopolysaccharide/colanic/teichoic acid biosynthesis glycosyltransferase